jgi:hypothetical protein
MRKVKVQQLGITCYHAGCCQCDFEAWFMTERFRTSLDVHRALSSHVRLTGHTGWIEYGGSANYRLEEIDESSKSDS